MQQYILTSPPAPLQRRGGCLSSEPGYNFYIKKGRHWSVRHFISLSVLAILFNQSSFSQVTQPAGVETYVIRKEAVTDASAVVSLTNAEKARTISYVDGLGRPVQSIVAAGSPDGKDIVSFNKYDSYGRQVKQYLPFEAGTTTGAYNDMSTIVSAQSTFYSPSTSAAKKIAGDDYPYAENSFEPSPLQRVLKAGGVGDGFQLTQNYKTLSYKNVTAAENIRIWVLGSSAATSTTTYGDDELTVSEVEDEHGVHAKVYKDKFGRLILKRQDTPTSGYYDTYYVYDNIGNIVYIVPPKALVKMGSSFTTASTPELIYRFRYDEKNRINQKKVPGATAVYMVYDPLDRVVLTQDGNMRSSSGTKWAYVKYDNANRVIIQGIYTHGSVVDQSAMQGYVNGLSYTDYYEVRQSVTSGYSNQSFPASGTEERGYNYFDNYDFDFDGNADYSKQNQGLTGEATATDLTYGLATGSKRKILGTSTWLIDVSFYDKYYHVIQVRSNNQQKTAVTDHTTNVVNFAGQALEARQVKNINNPSAHNNTRELEVSTRYEYDDMGRLTKVKQTNPGVSELTVAKYEYNALGQLVDKKLHSTNGTNYLQSVDMRYNIRGQLLSINNSQRNINTANNDENNDVFGMEILYDKQESTSLGNAQYYNGMISAVKWSAASPANTEERSFKYSYDKLYRLTASVYQEKNSLNGLWGKNQDAFNETLSYDENGNILTLLRKAVISSAVTTIDNLTYTYKNSDFNNQLENISDAVTTNTTGYGYRNFTGTGSSTPYSHDDNGNLTGDLKKGTTITYNELNKPTLIQISSTKKVEYYYDAAGTRVSKIVTNNSTVKTIEYIGGYVIENDILSYYSMAEGRVRNDGDNLGYNIVPVMEYFITDHQGNTRVGFEDNSGAAALIQENSYYAFGMQMAGSTMPGANPNKKLYNAGSEWQDDIDGLADYYSTFFREYDAVIGRFNGVDPMAVATDAITTYAYANNNPVMMNDPLGDRARWFDRIAERKQLDDVALKMRENYSDWHDSKYGNGSFRDWDFWGFDNGGNGGGGMSGFDYLSTYRGTRIRVNNFKSGNKRVYNEFGEFGYWISEKRTFKDEEAEGEGNTFGEVGVAAGRVWISLSYNSGNPFEVKDICTKSFKFTRILNSGEGGGGWQVAGVSNIHMNIVDLVTRKGVRIQLPNIYFGLPVLRANGDFYSVSYAANISAMCVAKAEKSIMEMYHSNPGGGLNMVAMSLVFRQKIDEQMRMFGGVATLSPGFKILVSPQPAVYSGILGMNCW